MPRSRTRVPHATRRSLARRRSGAYRASPTLTITYQTPPDPAFKRLVEATPSGWSGTGPPGTVCEQCSFYGYDAHPNSCYRYFFVTRQHGAAFPAETQSCQHFRPRSL
jgi:hypothetical protein